MSKPVTRQQNQTTSDAIETPNSELIKDHGGGMHQPAINLAFIGSGNWARKYHFPALEHLAEPPCNQRFNLRLQGIYSLEPEVATAVADQYGFDRVYPDLATLIDDDEVNAVAIAVTPTALKRWWRACSRSRCRFSARSPPASAPRRHKR